LEPATESSTINRLRSFPLLSKATHGLSFELPYSAVFYSRETTEAHRKPEKHIEVRRIPSTQRSGLNFSKMNIETARREQASMRIENWRFPVKEKTSC
jgi:hypothetical protein